TRCRSATTAAATTKARRSPGATASSRSGCCSNTGSASEGVMRRTAFFVVIALFMPRLSPAQDTPRFGIVMGYPAEVGILWNVSSRVAVRPEINWSKSHVETTSTDTPTVIFLPAARTSTGDSWQVGCGYQRLAVPVEG